MKTKKLAGGLLLLLLILGMLFAYHTFSEKPVSGAKHITIEVINQQGETTSYSVQTDAQYLHEAMEEAEGLTFDGTEGPYGFTLDTVNGEVADYNTDQAYWCIYVNGEYGNYGPDQQPVEDNDVFQLVYTSF